MNIPNRTCNKFWLKKETSHRIPTTDRKITGAYPRADLDQIVAFTPASLDALWRFEHRTEIRPLFVITTTKGEIHYFTDLEKVEDPYLQMVTIDNGYQSGPKEGPFSILNKVFI